MITPDRPAVSARELIEILQHIVRANYEQAALNAGSEGGTFEIVADAVANAVLAGWSAQTRRLPVADLAAAVSKSMSERAATLGVASPAGRAIMLIHNQIRSMAEPPPN